MKAAMIVRDRDGVIVEIGPEIPVDVGSVQAETLRLRAKYGRGVSIDSTQIVRARVALREREETLFAC